MDRSVDEKQIRGAGTMITVEDLRDSLRLQLGALVELYERDAAGRGLPPGESGRPRPASAGAVTGIDAAAAADAGHAARIEGSLVDFDAALRAASRAERAREGTLAAALAALERSLDLQRRAAAARREVERRVIAMRETRRAPLPGRPGTIERGRLAARAAEVAARKADLVASRLREHAQAAARCATAALLAAIQADPSRGNPGFDPAIARAARRVAERAARDAAMAAAAARDGEPGRGVVIQLTRVGRAADHRRPDAGAPTGRSPRTGGA
jgi:hypothetical protein